MIRVGISACIFHPDPQRPVFKGKTLYYIEQSLSFWMNSRNILAVMIPPPSPESHISLKDFAKELDGLVLHGGADVCPKSYGEDPLRPEWNGDFIRDQFEVSLFNEFLSENKPILGICRGAQILNVAQGGTLFQDITTQKPGALVHRDWNIYDQNIHSIVIEPNSRLQSLYNGNQNAKVNSIHHQGIKELGKNLIVEARCEEDGVIEAIRLDSPNYVCGYQWHPEFHPHTSPNDTELLSNQPILAEFLESILKRKGDSSS